MSDTLPDQRLADWFELNVDGASGPLTLEKFPGGQSNPTYRVRTPAGDYVLRRKPFGPLLASAHAVDREFRLLQALAPTGLPTPKPFALCEDDSVLGSTFYVMAMVEGRTFWDGALPGSDPAERRAVYEAMIDTLAALHAVDVEGAGLTSFGRPGNYFARQIERWSRQYRASETEPQPVMEALMAWLPGSAPDQTRTSVIHGDYRIDNLIFRTDKSAVAAILDWELATLGDPLADFAYLMMNWVLPHAPGKATLGGLDLPALGIPTLEEAAARYCAATGRETVPNLDWFFAYSLFRSVGIMQGIKKRALEGNASGSDTAGFVVQIPGLLDRAWAFAVRAGAAPALLAGPEPGRPDVVG